VPFASTNQEGQEQPLSPLPQVPQADTDSHRALPDLSPVTAEINDSKPVFCDQRFLSCGCRSANAFSSRSYVHDLFFEVLDQNPFIRLAGSNRIGIAPDK